VEGAGVGHAVGQQHGLGTADFQDAPLDGSIGEVVPGFGVGPSVVLFAIRGTGNGPCPVQPVVALAVNLRVVVRPLCLLQLAIQHSIGYHVAFNQSIIIYSIVLLSTHRLSFSQNVSR
jgi:hypothetical protein